MTDCMRIVKCSSQLKGFTIQFYLLWSVTLGLNRKKRERKEKRREKCFSVLVWHEGTFFIHASINVNVCSICCSSCHDYPLGAPIITCSNLNKTEQKTKENFAKQPTQT